MYHRHGLTESARAVPHHRRPGRRRAPDQRRPRRRSRSAGGAVDPSLAELPDLLGAYVRRGGKRLRPAFLLAGVLAAGGDPTTATGRRPRRRPRAAARLRPHPRRRDGRLGHPSGRSGPARRSSATSTDGQGGRGESRRFGEGLAVLAGDLAHVYADRLVPAWRRGAGGVGRAARRAHHGPVPRRARRRPRCRHPERSRRIATLKSGRYTIVRPLHLAAALAGGPTSRRPSPPSASRWAGPSSCATTCSARSAPRRPPASRPATTSARPSPPCCSSWPARPPTPAAAAVLDAGWAAPTSTTTTIASLRDVLVDSGALAAVEAEIERDAAAAAAALDGAPITPAGRDLLDDLRRTVVDRDRLGAAFSAPRRARRSCGWCGSRAVT